MKNEKECNIVRDLLLGYSDGVLSKDSEKLVEQHLKNCEKCNNLLDEINKEKQNENNEQIHEIDYLKKVRKKVNKKNKIIIIIGIILSIIIFLNIILSIKYKMSLGNMVVYLDKDVTEEQISNIEKAIKEIDNKAEIIYHSKEKALNDMKEELGENSNFLDGYNEENSPLLSYYEIKVNSNLAQKVQDKLLSIPGVKAINGNVN